MYPCLEDRGKGVVVSYQGDRRRPNRRYLYAADELGYRRQQSYVHDIIVNIAVGGRRYRFRVFFKRHKALPENQAIKALPGATVTFDGDVVLAAIGPRVAIRNMGPRAERAAADIAICKYVLLAMLQSMH